MNVKQIITIVVLIAVLAGAIVFAWTTFFSGRSQPAATLAPSSQILPHGTKLDFKTVQELNPSKRTYQYPVVTPGEVGLNLGELTN
jgi:flagellar basal body-associated protein FliL